MKWSYIAFGYPIYSTSVSEYIVGVASVLYDKVKGRYEEYMSEMFAYGKKIVNVFQLIGTLENDITKSIAWVLCNCPMFMKRVVFEIFDEDINPDKVRICYQEFEKDKGITDLEVTDDDLFYIILEAKRGWVLPCAEQLNLYSERSALLKSKAKHKAIITMSECSQEYADAYLETQTRNKISVYHLSWKKIYELAMESNEGSNNVQKNLLGELREYLGEITTMQNKDSNWVYVVSLSDGHPENCSLTWIDIVKKQGTYFHPVGGKTGGWPKTPPNYIGFRYYGQLQSIHHIEGYEISRNLHNQLSEMPNEECKTNYFVYKLGPAIKPMHTVKTGKIYPSGRVWAMLDTLLTSESISEARDISKERKEL